MCKILVFVIIWKLQESNLPRRCQGTIIHSLHWKLRGIYDLKWVSMLKKCLSYQFFSNIYNLKIAVCNICYEGCYRHKYLTCINCILYKLVTSGIEWKSIIYKKFLLIFLTGNWTQASWVKTTNPKPLHHMEVGGTAKSSIKFLT